MDSIESFSELAQRIISGVEALAQKIVVYDDGPILERLQQGDFAETPALPTEVDPFIQVAISAEYDRHIALLEEAFRKLKSAKDDFKRSVDLRLSLLAPIRHLPEDILVEIFSHFIQDGGTRQGSEERTYSLTLSKKHRIFSPSFTLSCVCSFWRRVVFSRPIFWSSFSLDLGGLRAFEGESKMTAILSQCLSRSANAPLSLHLKLDSADHALDSGNLLSLFIGQAARWEWLDLPDYRSISRFISQLQSGGQPPIFSSLRHLNLGEGRRSEMTLSLLPIVLSASHLETLSTGRCGFTWSDFCQCDFSSLKKLKASTLSNGTVGQFLSRLPSLEVCILTSTSGFTTDSKPSSASYSSNLRCLSIRLEDSLVGAWQSLRTPHLLRLFLEARDGTEESHIESVSSMLVRSKSVLQELTLFNIYAHEALNFINAHPSVTDIILSGSYESVDDNRYPGDLFSRLSFPKEENTVVLAPNLRSLTIQIQGSITDSDGSSTLDSHIFLAQNIVKMVKSRTDEESLPPDATVLQKFTLRLMSRHEEVFGHIRRSLAHLVASGLQLELDQYLVTYSALQDL
ncbi:hypothetical protein GYMLUDRAFT_260571 [Collybiopsis luxurians FD-317 M1]|uniref:F-box domain-containing protein n=1 Tax=Collybiopsis luxurians FD-317 M1 TaxID=944289 RepID=A0A0D0C1W4_9AGAR|nr:hypothetical protein GYMLUDRAFT_260571 [Collybiopsis luxurians FD-317 M1]